MKKYIAIAAIVLLIIVGFFLFRRQTATIKLSSDQPVSISETLNLPTGWKIISESDTMVKLEKTVTSGLKPQIVFKKTSSKDALTPAKYTDQLKAGAKATLSGLVYLTDKRNSQESTYTAFLTGYYLNRGQKIFINQRLYIQGETVYTLTGSFGSGLDEEIEQIIDNISKEKISL
jgi:hypothetical protein